MANKPILLLEDNPDDETLTCMALRENRLLNKIGVSHDGVEAIDCLFGQGEYAGRDLRPQMVLLDLKLPKLDGLDLLRAIRDDERRKSLPGVILPSSNEERDRVAGYRLGANSDVRKPADFHQFTVPMKQIGLYQLLLNEPPPRSDR